MITLVAAAAAQDAVALHGAEELRFRYYRAEPPEASWMYAPLFGFVPGVDVPAEDYMELVDKLDLLAASPHWSMGVRGDLVSLFQNRYRLDGNLVVENPLVGDGLWSPIDDTWFALEKVWVEGRAKQVTAVVGDSYTAIGNGIVLNAVKYTDLDIDTSIRGARATLRPGGAGDVELVALTGTTNPQQVRLDYPNAALAPDDGHGVTALQFARYGRVAVESHGVMVRWRPEGGYPGEPTVWAYGASVRASEVAGVDLAGEFDGFLYEADEVPVQDGWAGYVSAAAYPGMFTVLVEGKRYRDAEWINALSNGYELATAPSLEYERVITEDSAATVNSNDVWGARIKTTATLGTLIPELSFAAFRDDDTAGLHFNEDPETVLHPVAGLTWTHDGTSLLAHAGVRNDLREGETGDRAVHADASFEAPIGPIAGELTASTLDFRWGDNAFQQQDYRDLSVAMALKLPKRVTTIVYLDSSDNPLVDSTGNVGEDLYLGGELQWMPTSATTLKAFYGAYRAGIRCAGGQCRQLPGFDGAKFSLTTTF